MKQFKLLIIAVLLLTVSSCDNSTDVSTPNINITTETDTYKVGDIVTFNISGEADYVTFYSGERGNSYEYANADRINTTRSVDLAFTLKYQNGAQTSDLVRVLYSTNFDGDYSIEGIDRAQWEDITDLCDMPTEIINSNPGAIRRSNVNMSDIFKANDNVYIAYRYQIRKMGDGVGQRTNAILENFEIKYEDDYDIHQLTNQSTASWKEVKYQNFDHANDKVTINSQQVVFTVNGSPTVDKTAYAISAPMAVNNEVNQGPDRAVTIKDYSLSMVQEYSHSFSEPGEYEVIFVSSNVYENEVREKIQRIKLNIVE